MAYSFQEAVRPRSYLFNGIIPSNETLGYALFSTFTSQVLQLSASEWI